MLLTSQISFSEFLTCYNLFPYIKQHTCIIVSHNLFPLITTTTCANFTLEKGFGEQH